jgi:hypothetical protein
MSIRDDLLKSWSDELAALESDEGDYRKSKNRAHFISVACRLAAIAAFIVGSLTPFVAHLYKEPDQLHILYVGYSSLVFAGILAGIDQVFLASQNWRRFAIAEMDVRLVRQLLAFDRSRFELTTAPNDEIAKEKIDSVHALLVQARTQAATIIKQETAAWALDLEQAGTRFDLMIKAAAEQVQKDISVSQAETARSEAAQASGAVKVIFENADRITGKLLITVGDQSKEFVRPPPSLVFENQPPGLRKIRLSWKEGEDMRELEEIATVESSKCVPVVLNVPKT